MSTRSIPGDPGLPLVGVLSHTLEFMRGWEAYFVSRRALYGGVFRTNIGGPAITLLDPIAVAAALDATKVRKRYGFGPRKPKPALIGGIVPIMFTNDAEHDRLKGLLLGVLRRRAGLLPALYAEISAPWRTALLAGPAFDACRAVEELLAQLIFRWLFDLPPSAQIEAADLRGWLDTLLAPKFAPWPTAVDRTMAESYARLFVLARGSPVVEAFPHADLEAAGLDREQLARHLLFVGGFNAWSGMRGLLGSMVAELALMPAEDRAALRGADPWHPPADLSAENAGVHRVVLETLRMHPPAPIVFGEARADFRLPTRAGDVEVKAGELLMSVLSLAQRDPSLGDPDTFRPGRFTDASLPSRCLFWAGGPDGLATGSTNTVCPGQDVVPAIARAFANDWLKLDVVLSGSPQWSTVKMIQANRPERGVQVARLALLDR